jgi:hypothetical protein
MKPQKIKIGHRTFTILFPDLLRPLHENEKTPLRVSIKKRGVITPIITDEGNGIIDGANRLAIAAELGLANVPIEVRRNLTHEKKLELALELNDARRHLSATDRQNGKQKREAIAESLKADPTQSNRKVAEEVGASPTTVGTVRQELESSIQIGQIDTRTVTRGDQEYQVDTSSIGKNGTEPDKAEDQPQGDACDGPLEREQPSKPPKRASIAAFVSIQDSVDRTESFLSMVLTYIPAKWRLRYIERMRHQLDILEQEIQEREHAQGEETREENRADELTPH